MCGMANSIIPDQRNDQTALSKSPINRTNSMNLYPRTKGYLRETCKSQNINPIYLTLSSPSVLFIS